MLALLRTASLGRASSAQAMLETPRGDDHEAALRRCGDNIAAGASRMYRRLSRVRSDIGTEQRSTGSGGSCHCQPECIFEPCSTGK